MILLNKINKINSMLELPKELYTGNPKMVILGFGEVIVENHKGILEYEDDYIKLKTNIGIINIDGSDLHLAKMTEDNLSITGKISNISISKLV